MSFGACEVHTSIKDANIGDLVQTNKKIRKLKLEQISIHFPNLGSIQECMLVCYSDASFTNLRNASSQGGCNSVFKNMRISLLEELEEALEACYMIRAILLERYKQPNNKIFPINHC